MFRWCEDLPRWGLGFTGAMESKGRPQSLINLIHSTGAYSQFAPREHVLQRKNMAVVDLPDSFYLNRKEIVLSAFNRVYLRDSVRNPIWITDRQRFLMESVGVMLNVETNVAFCFNGTLPLHYPSFFVRHNNPVVVTTMLKRTKTYLTRWANHNEGNKEGWIHVRRKIWSL